MTSIQIVLVQDSYLSCVAICSVVAIGFPTGATLNATEEMTTTVNICPQLLEGTLEMEVSVNATTSDISARGINIYM